MRAQGSLRAGTCCEHRFGHRPRRPEPGRILPGRASRPVAPGLCERISYSNLERALTVPKKSGLPAYSQPDTRKAATRSRDPRRSGHAQPRPPPPTQPKASTSKKSLKAALALGGGLVTVGLMAAMLTDDDGPPEDVVDGVQSTMNGLVDRAAPAKAMAAWGRRSNRRSVGCSRPRRPLRRRRRPRGEDEDEGEDEGAQGGKAAKKAAAAPVTPPERRRLRATSRSCPRPHARGREARRRRARSAALGRRVRRRRRRAARRREYEVEWTDTPNVFNTVAAADVRAGRREPAPPPPPRRRRRRPRPAPPAPAPRAAATTSRREGPRRSRS